MAPAISPNGASDMEKGQIDRLSRTDEECQLNKSGGTDATLKPSNNANESAHEPSYGINPPLNST